MFSSLHLPKCVKVGGWWRQRIIYCLLLICKIKFSFVVFFISSSIWLRSSLLLLQISLFPAVSNKLVFNTFFTAIGVSYLFMMYFIFEKNIGSFYISFILFLVAFLNFCLITSKVNFINLLDDTNSKVDKKNR